MLPRQHSQNGQRLRICRHRVLFVCGFADIEWSMAANSHAFIILVIDECMSDERMRYADKCTL